MPRPAALLAATDEHPEVQTMLVEDLVIALCEQREGISVLDVRTQDEFSVGKIAGAQHVPSERFLEEGEAGETLAKDLLSSAVVCGAKTLVVYCMYSQCRGPTVANMLAAVSRVEDQKIDIVLLDGGFHKFLNTVAGNAEEPKDVRGLIEGTRSKSWRRTKTRGFVEASEVEQLDQLSPTASGATAMRVMALLKSHDGRLGLDDLDKLCQRASPSLALSRDELSGLFQILPKDSQGLVDWHEFVDYIYTDGGAVAQPQAAC